MYECDGYEICIYSQHNARIQARREAERTLYAVACKRLLGQDGKDTETIYHFTVSSPPVLTEDTAILLRNTAQLLGLSANR